jgi:hypothetical protein
MPFLNNVEIWYAKLDPARPNGRYNKNNPTWEVQIRTTDKAQKKEWEALHLPVKTVDPDEGPVYYSVSLRKKSHKEVDKVVGEPNKPVEVVDGDLEPIDTNTIGNGSVGNVRIFQYPYPKEGGGTGIASMLMGVQLTKHVVYESKPREGFTQQATTRVQSEQSADQEDGDAGNPDEDGDAPFTPDKPKPSAPSLTPKTSVAGPKVAPEDEF